MTVFNDTAAFAAIGSMSATASGAARQDAAAFTAVGALLPRETMRYAGAFQLAGFGTLNAAATGGTGASPAKAASLLIGL